MRDESVRSRVTVPAGRRCVTRLSVGGRGRGEGDVLRRRALFGRAFTWHFSFNRRIVDSVSYMTREIEFENRLAF